MGPLPLKSLGVVLPLLAGCVGVKPVVLDRHAQLENQILGRLQQLEGDLILASSVRGEQGAPADGREAPDSPLTKEAIDAARRRAFNADDLDQFKARQQIGERSDGQLQILRTPDDARRARWLRELVAQENHDRAVLMRRVLQLSPELKRDGLELVQHAFHRLVLQTASPGHRVQRRDGQWITVPSAQKSAP